MRIDIAQVHPVTVTLAQEVMAQNGHGQIIKKMNKKNNRYDENDEKNTKENVQRQNPNRSSINCDDHVRQSTSRL